MLRSFPFVFLESVRAKPTRESSALRKGTTNQVRLGKRTPANNIQLKRALRVKSTPTLAALKASPANDESQGRNSFWATDGKILRPKT